MNLEINYEWYLSLKNYSTKYALKTELIFSLPLLVIEGEITIPTDIEITYKVKFYPNFVLSSTI